MGEQITQISVISEMENSFKDYAMSVITDRAIPSVEDGLKPVHRRILWSMFKNGLFSNKKYVKCATPVGDTISHYHPHGDSSTYGALVGMSQPWNMRYPLIDFHGNNGSRDGDEAAAYRYTECRLSKYGEYMLKDIKKHTVDFVKNFDETLEEPVYLPGSFPNLLCNGTSGIAVAMACSFLPHNLTSIMDAAIANLKNPDISICDLVDIVKAPDFPTGGIIVNQKEMLQAYSTGKGRVKLRGEYHEEEIQGHPAIVFTSIPYKISKESLIMTIDSLCEAEELKNVLKIRDESTRKGVRFVIELTKGTNIELFANQLFKLTNLENSYSFNMVTLVDKVPKLLNLKDLIYYYNKHQLEILYKKTTFEKDEAEKKLHIIEGLLIALEDIDNIIHTIKISDNVPSAIENLSKEYHLSEAQAKAIVEMKLGKLAKLEKITLLEQKAQLELIIAKTNEILHNPDTAKSVLCNEYKNIIDKFGDERLSRITQIDVDKALRTLATIPAEDCIVSVSAEGRIKRIPSKKYKVQKKQGVGIKNNTDLTVFTYSTNTVDTLSIFTNKGKMYRILINDIPEGTNSSKGVLISELIKFEENEVPVAYSCLYADSSAKYVFFATKRGIVKRVPLEEYQKIKKNSGIIAMTLKEGDSPAVITFLEEEEILLITKNSRLIRFCSTDLPVSSRVAQGVIGIKLDDGDEVIACLPIKHPTDALALFTKEGLGKKILLTDCPVQKRSGKGAFVYKEKEIIGAALIEDKDILMITGDKTTICIKGKDIVEQSKKGSGGSLIKNNNCIVSITKMQ